MSDFLDDEKWHLLSNSDEDIPMSIRFSQIMTKYKIDFINLHKNPLPGAHEEAVEATQLLLQRMRLSLGLPVDFINLYNPLHGAIYGRSDKKYKPEVVMRLFLEGGRIVFERGEHVSVQEISPYTPALQISLVRTAVEDRSNKFLKLEHLNAYVQSDAFLQEQFEEAFIMFEETEYFDPQGEGSRIYNPRSAIEHQNVF